MIISPKQKAEILAILDQYPPEEQIKVIRKLQEYVKQKEMGEPGNPEKFGLKAVTESFSKKTTGVIKFIYFILWAFIIPIVIGGSVGHSLHTMYSNFNSHILAGVGVCFLSGAVVTWIPMGFVFESLDINQNMQLINMTLLMWIAGSITPIFFGFENLGLTITVLLIFSSFYIVKSIGRGLKDNKM